MKPRRMRKVTRLIIGYTCTALIGTMLHTWVAKADCPHVPQDGPSASQWADLAPMTSLLSTSCSSHPNCAGEISSNKTSGLDISAHVVDGYGRYAIEAVGLRLQVWASCRWPTRGRISVQHADGTLHVATFAETCGYVVLDGQALMLE